MNFVPYLVKCLRQARVLLPRDSKDCVACQCTFRCDLEGVVSFVVLQCGHWVCQGCYDREYTMRVRDGTVGKRKCHLCQRPFTHGCLQEPMAGALV